MQTAGHRVVHDVADNLCSLKTGYDDASCAQTLSTDLELRFDQRHQMTIGTDEGGEGVQDQTDRNEAEIGYHQLRSTAHGQGVEVTHGLTRHFDHPRVSRYQRRKLPMPHIESDHLACSGLQQYLGEATGRRTDIDAPSALDDDGKGFQRRYKLVGRAAYPPLGVALNLDDGLGLDPRRRLGHHNIRYSNLSIAQQLRSDSPRTGHLAHDKCLIQPHIRRSSVREVGETSLQRLVRSKERFGDETEVGLDADLELQAHVHPVDISYDRCGFHRASEIRGAGRLSRHALLSGSISTVACTSAGGCAVIEPGVVRWAGVVLTDFFVADFLTADFLTADSLTADFFAVGFD